MNILEIQLILQLKLIFLDACRRIYKKVCQSVGLLYISQQQGRQEGGGKGGNLPRAPS